MVENTRNPQEAYNPTEVRRINTQGVIQKQLGVGDFPGGPVVRTLLSNTEGVGSIPGWGIKILHAMRCHQTLKKKKEPDLIKKKTKSN